MGAIFWCDFFRALNLQVFGEMPGPKSFLERSRAVGQPSVFFLFV